MGSGCCSTSQDDVDYSCLLLLLFLGLYPLPTSRKPDTPSNEHICQALPNTVEQ
ncbi:Crossover junction endodeoxyribonuclease RuvC, partial [Dissostichus eleginoides]